MPWPAQFLNMEVDLLDPEADEVLLGLLSRDNEPVPKHPPYRTPKEIPWYEEPYFKEQLAQRRAREAAARENARAWEAEMRRRAREERDRALRRLRNPGVLVETQRLINPGSWTAYWKSDR
jgi:hypothetical protein